MHTPAMPLSMCHISMSLLPPGPWPAAAPNTKCDAPAGAPPCPAVPPPNANCRGGAEAPAAAAAPRLHCGWSPPAAHVRRPGSLPWKLAGGGQDRSCCEPAQAQAGPLPDKRSPPPRAWAAHVRTASMCAAGHTPLPLHPPPHPQSPVPGPSSPPNMGADVEGDGAGSCAGSGVRDACMNEAPVRAGGAGEALHLSGPASCTSRPCPSRPPPCHARLHQQPARCARLARTGHGGLSPPS